MKMPQIRIESQLSQIGIKQFSGKQELRQPKAELSIEQPRADLTMQSKRAQLTIDQTQAFEEANLMGILRRTELIAQEAKNMVLEGMERRASQGAEMMKIENGGNPLASQAMINGYDQMKTLGIKFIPSPLSVKINYEPADLRINAKANAPNINVQLGKVEHQYERGNVDIYIEKYGYLDIDYTHKYSEVI